MDSIVHIFVLIIVVVGFGLVIFALKRKYNLDKTQGIIKQDYELIHGYRDKNTTSSNNAVAKATESEDRKSVV